MAGSLEERIIAFTADERGMEPQQIHLDSRLFHDLGMDGDDAVEFFERFGSDFHVDLTRLWARWSQHFGPEGGANPVVLVFIGVAVGIAGLLHELIQGVPFWAWCIPLVPAACWLAGRLAGPDPRIFPITVDDLVIAAKAGTWAE